MKDMVYEVQTYDWRSGITEQVRFDTAKSASLYVECRAAGYNDVTITKRQKGHAPKLILASFIDVTKL